MHYNSSGPALLEYQVLRYQRFLDTRTKGGNETIVFFRYLLVHKRTFEIISIYCTYKYY